jgi:hypothetical protein
LDASFFRCANQPALRALNILTLATGSAAIICPGFRKMRIISVVLLITVAFVSTASAQRASSSFSMDHGHAADAASAARAAAAAERAKAAAIAAGLPLAPSQSTDFKVNGSGVVKAAAPLTPEEQKADAEARAAWLARCRPTVVEDRDGLRRTQYADSNCDLSRFNTAGAQ